MPTHWQRRAAPQRLSARTAAHPLPPGQVFIPAGWTPLTLLDGWQPPSTGTYELQLQLGGTAARFEFKRPQLTSRRRPAKGESARLPAQDLGGGRATAAVLLALVKVPGEVCAWLQERQLGLGAGLGTMHAPE